MATIYVRDLPQNQKTHKFTEFDRWYAERCQDCGGEQPCKCKYCNSCSELWVGETADYGDEDGHPRKICPDCIDAGCAA